MSITRNRFCSFLTTRRERLSLNHSLGKGSQGKASQELANEILTFLGFSFVSVCMSISIPLHLLSNTWIPESAPFTSSYEQEFVLTSEFCFSLSFSVLSALRFLVSTTTNNKSGRKHLVGAWWLLLSCLANKKQAAPFLDVCQTLKLFWISLLLCYLWRIKIATLTEDYQHWVDGGVGQGQGDGKQGVCTYEPKIKSFIGQSQAAFNLHHHWKKTSASCGGLGVWKPVYIGALYVLRWHVDVSCVNS